MDTFADLVLTKFLSTFFFNRANLNRKSFAKDKKQHEILWASSFIFWKIEEVKMVKVMKKTKEWSFNPFARLRKEIIRRSIDSYRKIIVITIRDTIKNAQVDSTCNYI